MSVVYFSFNWSYRNNTVVSHRQYDVSLIPDNCHTRSFGFFLQNSKLNSIGQNNLLKSLPTLRLTLSFN